MNDNDQSTARVLPHPIQGDSQDARLLRELLDVSTRLRARAAKSALTLVYAKCPVMDGEMSGVAQWNAVHRQVTNNINMAQAFIQSALAQQSSTGGKR